MNPKKIFRYLSILTKYIIVKIFNKLFFLNNLKVIPSLESLNFSRIQYSSKSRRYIFRNQSNKIEKILRNPNSNKVNNKKNNSLETTILNEIRK